MRVQAQVAVDGVEHGHVDVPPRGLLLAGPAILADRGKDCCARRRLWDLDCRRQFPFPGLKGLCSGTDDALPAHGIAFAPELGVEEMETYAPEDMKKQPLPTASPLQTVWRSRFRTGIGPVPCPSVFSVGRTLREGPPFDVRVALPMAPILRDAIYGNIQEVPDVHGAQARRPL